MSKIPSQRSGPATPCLGRTLRFFGRLVLGGACGLALCLLFTWVFDRHLTPSAMLSSGGDGPFGVTMLFVSAGAFSLALVAGLVGGPVRCGDVRRRWLVPSLWVVVVALLVAGAMLTHAGSRRGLIGIVRNEPFVAQEPASVWVERLKSGAPEQRYTAVSRLKAVGTDHPEVVPALLAAFRDSDADVRRYAMRTASAHRPVHPDVAQALADILAVEVREYFPHNFNRKSDLAVVFDALEQLAEAPGSGWEITVPDLCRLYALRQAWYTEGQIERLLQKAAPDLTFPKAGSFHRNWLGSPQDFERDARLAADAMRTLGRGAAAAYRSELVRLLKTGSASDRSFAAYALAGCRQDAAGAAPDLMAVVEAPDESERDSLAAAHALRSIGSPELAVRAFGLILKRQVVTTAIQGLADLRQGEAVPVLLDALGRVEKSQREVRIALHKALGAIGPKAEAAVPRLFQARWDIEEHQEVQQAAGDALVAIGAGVVPSLTAYLKDEYVFKRILAAELLWRINQDEQALAVLVGLLENGGNADRREAGKALTRLGAPALPSLLRALKSERETAREAAAIALGEIGPPAKEAAPDLRRRLTDTQELVRVVAARALWQVAGDPAGVPVLVELVDKESQWARAAAHALGDLGPVAKAAIPSLSRTYRSGNGAYAEAGRALQAIDPAAAKQAGVK